jgi:sugar lactone lactonase YvrE
MPLQSGRYRADANANLAEGWSMERLTPPSRLFGANGLRTGADGRIYVAQVAGSQVSAINVDTGEIETISPLGGDIVGPDDLAFDEAGNLYATEITENRVCMRTPNGTTRVIWGDMPVANPITYYRGHLIAGECRAGARIMELDRNGGEPRIILDNVPMVNAFEVGPDGKLYFPVMGLNEIWRIGLEGGEPEVVARELGLPDSVKFNPKGQIVSTQVASGQVLQIDPLTGARTVLADIAPGLDNCTFVGDRLFVSSISGQVNEILAPGKIRSVVPDGLQWPLDLAVSADGEIFVADGGFAYSLRPGNKLQLLGMLFSPGFPGYTRCAVAAGPGEWIVTTANGDVARYIPSQNESHVLARGYDRLMGLAIAPGGAVVFAEFATGRVLCVVNGEVSELATGLKEPKGVAVAADGTCYVSESAGGRVVKIVRGRTETVIDGLGRPEGIALAGGRLYVLDVKAQQLIELDLASGVRRTLASHLPVGAPAGVVPKTLGAVGTMCGPMGNFTGIAAGPDGTIYVAGDAEGSVLAIRAA